MLVALMRMAVVLLAAAVPAGPMRVSPQDQLLDHKEHAEAHNEGYTDTVSPLGANSFHRLG